MRILILTIAFTFLIILSNSCEDSLGLDENVENDLLSNDIDTINYESFIPKFRIADTTLWQVYQLLDNDNIDWGEYAMVLWLVTKDSAIWNHKPCVYAFLLKNTGPWNAYYYYNDGKKLYSNPTMPINRGTWSPEMNIKLPELENQWVLRVDFSDTAKSWIGLDSFQIDNYQMRYDISFTGKRFIRGEKVKDTILYIARRSIRCLQVREYMNFTGMLKREMLPDTNINYTYSVDTYFAENNIGDVMEIEKLPEYNFGYGEIPSRGFRTEIAGF